MSQQTGSSSGTSVPQIRYETLNHKVLRKFRENPLIPFGIFATVFALVGATMGFYRGDSRTMQRFLRLRVAAQGFTVVATASVPIYYQINRHYNNNNNNKKVEKESAGGGNEER